MQLAANDLTDLKPPACKGAGGRGEALKSKVTNPVFVPDTISAVFRLLISGYKAYVRTQCDFFNILHTSHRLQTVRSI